MSLLLASIHVYPVKSLGGFAVNEARMTDRGFEHDRRWMLVDTNGRFLSQREIPAMACLHTSPLDDGFRVADVRNGATVALPWEQAEGRRMTAGVWDDVVQVIAAAPEHAAWFSERLGIACTLVYMPDDIMRPTDPAYADAYTSLSDAFPYLIISQASLDDLNTRIAPVPMDRFRPNLVIAGGAPFQEDDWERIAIGTSHFDLVKPCARCSITTTDQLTGERGKEPLATLARYRRRSGGGTPKVDFGMNAIGSAGGVVRVGDMVQHLS